MTHRTARRSRVATADLVIGAIAGTAATVAMTVAADALFRRLPADERYPLPPRELTERTLENVGADRRIPEGGIVAATIVAHFAFGAVAGSVFPLLRARFAPHPVSGGIGYGLVVWTLSYFGWVPAFGLLRSAASHPLRRSALMVLVHVVWGAALGVVDRQLSRSLAALRGGRVGDR